MKRDRETGLFFAQKIFQKIDSPSKLFPLPGKASIQQNERKLDLRNVSHILEKQLTDYLVTVRRGFTDWRTAT